MDARSPRLPLSPSAMAEVRKKIERATAEAAARKAAEAASPFFTLCRGSDEVLTVEHLDRAKADPYLKPARLTIAALDELIDAVETGPRFLWVPPLPPVDYLNLFTPPRQPIPAFFGRKRRARRARGRVRQLRAARTPAHWDLFELFR